MNEERRCQPRKARDIVGYSMLQFAALVPLVLFLVWILNFTFAVQQIATIIECASDGGKIF